MTPERRAQILAAVDGKWDAEELLAEVDALTARAEAAEEELLSVDAHGVRDAFQLREEIAGLTADRDALAARVRVLEGFVRELEGFVRLVATTPAIYADELPAKARALLAGDGKP